MCDAALYKTVLIVIKMSGFPIIEVKMNLLLMFEDAAFFLSGRSLNLAVAFYSSCFHTSEERQLGEPGSQEIWVKNHFY